VKRVRFVAPARRELLAEVAYYSNSELELGSRFLAAVEDATARALAYPLTGTLASENTRRLFLKGTSKNKLFALLTKIKKRTLSRKRVQSYWL
jgi:hypothetical protein